MTLEEIVQAALTIGDIESAAIFVTRPGSSALQLAAAAGLSGPPLDGLVAAVQSPAHPVARAVTDLGPTFDVQPMNPGGPALRSHLPLGGKGVLAVAHETSLSPDDRRALEDLADTATDAVGAVDDGMAQLLEGAEAGDRDAIDQLVELAGERGDGATLMRLARQGNRDAAGVLIELASERGDLATLKDLAGLGFSDAAEVLEELASE